MDLENRLNVGDGFRVIHHSVGSAPMQMAIDHSLLEIMERRLKRGLFVRPVVRTYQFDNNAIILGYNQKRDKFCSNLGDIYLTTRVTGGGHMYFSSDDINFAVIIPRKYVAMLIREFLCMA